MEKNCALVAHIGKDSNSAYGFAINCFDNLMSQSCHLERVVKKQTDEQILRNRLQLKTSIDVVWRLAFQTCIFGGHRKCFDSNN